MRMIALAICFGLSATAAQAIEVIPNPFVESPARDTVIKGQVCRAAIAGYRRCLERGPTYPFRVCVEPPTMCLS